MKFDPNRHHRRSIRLPGYDYTQPGAYFVTICTYQRECTLGAIQNRIANLSSRGHIVEQCWRALPEHASFIDLDAHIIMPNHLHGIIVIKHAGSRSVTAPDSPPASAPAKGTQSGSLGAVIQNFKSVSTRKINQTLQASGTPIWQRGYYEWIIRDDAELGRVRRYIETNPERWARNA
jgi:REP element-mobilizing transposase RayT